MINLKKKQARAKKKSDSSKKMNKFQIEKVTNISITETISHEMTSQTFSTENEILVNKLFELASAAAVFKFKFSTIFYSTLKACFADFLIKKQIEHVIK